MYYYIHIHTYIHTYIYIYIYIYILKLYFYYSVSHFKFQLEQLENLELETAWLVCLLYDTPIFFPIGVFERSIFYLFFIPEKLNAILKQFVISARNKIKLWLPQRVQKSSLFSHKIFACTPSRAYLLLVPWLWQ